MDNRRGLNARVAHCGFRVQGSGFRVQGSGLRVQGSGFSHATVQGIELFVKGYGLFFKGLWVGRCSKRVPGTPRIRREGRTGHRRLSARSSSRSLPIRSSGPRCKRAMPVSNAPPRDTLPEWSVRRWLIRPNGQCYRYRTYLGSLPVIDVAEAATRWARESCSVQLHGFRSAIISTSPVRCSYPVPRM